MLGFDVSDGTPEFSGLTEVSSSPFSASSSLGAVLDSMAGDLSSGDLVDCLKKSLL
jgi:hypothetical protein